MMLALILSSFVLLVANACQPPDCDRPDLGTCVEACCKIGWNVTGMDAATFSNTIGGMLKSGGPDSLYLYWGTQPNQGPLTYVVQGIHQSATIHYNDTLNFGIIASNNGAKACYVEAFSHSQDFIVGDFAYGDDGQNYKNLAQLINAIAVNGVSFTLDNLFGCPPSNGGPRSFYKRGAH